MNKNLFFKMEGKNKANNQFIKNKIPILLIALVGFFSLSFSSANMGYGNTANPVNLAYGYKPNSGVTQYLQNIANVSTQCSGTDKVYNVSIIGGVLSIQCATDQTGGASSSYNSTYDKWAYNQTTATFNQYGTQWYNHTSSVETLYGKWFYNMSDGGMNYDKVVLTNASYINFTTNDAIIKINGFNSLLDSPTEASGGLYINQTRPEAKAGVWWNAYDEASGKVRTASWITTHYNSTDNANKHQHISIEVLNNFTGTTSVDSVLAIDYGSEIKKSSVNIYNSDLNVNNRFLVNTSSTIKATPNTTFDIYPNGQNTLAFRFSNNSNNMTVSGLGTNDIEFLDNIMANAKNISAAFFKGDGRFLGNINVTNITGIINTSRCDATTGKLINVTFNNGVLQGECATDQSGSSSALPIYKSDATTTNTTGLTFSTLYTIPLTANTNYTINCYMLRSSNATTSGVRYNMSLPGIPDWMSFSMYAPTTATAVQNSVVSGATISLMPTAVTASLAYPTYLNDELNIFIDGNANTGGNAILQFSGELANLLAVIRRGSYCEVNIVS